MNGVSTLIVMHSDRVRVSVVVWNVDRDLEYVGLLCTTRYDTVNSEYLHSIRLLSLYAYCKTPKLARKLHIGTY